MPGMTFINHTKKKTKGLFRHRFSWACMYAFSQLILPHMWQLFKNFDSGARDTKQGYCILGECSTTEILISASPLVAGFLFFIFSFDTEISLYY